MARSLKTSYLLLALGVSAVLALILGSLAYYEHRVNTSDANQLTYATVEQKLESDLEARAKSLSASRSGAHTRTYCTRATTPRPARLAPAPSCCVPMCSGSAVSKYG
jgi:hypothetical protein